MATLPAIHAMDEAPGAMATVDMIDAWMEVAAENDRFLYATRTVLPIGARGGARMRVLMERGLVELQRRRSTLEPTMWNYIARRTGAPTALTRPTRPTLRLRCCGALTSSDRDVSAATRRSAVEQDR